jgi:protein-L-isoaspartate(D-aspartate) O-methyltransferase
MRARCERPALASALAVGLALAAPATSPTPAPDFTEQRAQLMRMLRANAEAIGGIDPAVLAAMERVPRHRFVPTELVHLAYLDRPLPIGEDQTISQPFVVAYMTHLLEVAPGARVLEVGTGSGYQAAVLRELGCEVWSIEIVRALGERTATLLAALGYRVALRIGDGYLGWPEAAPFDGIVVTAGTTEVPAPLLAQLRPGARLVLPLADASGEEYLTVVTRHADGRFTRDRKIPVRFVPLTRGDPR